MTTARLVSLLFAVVALLAVLAGACAGPEPTPTPTTVKDRYGNAISLDDALEVMTAGARQVLQDANAGSEGCLAVYTDWKQTFPLKYEPIDGALLEDLLSRLRDELPVEVHLADRETAGSPCTEQKAPRYILFEQLVLSDTRLYVAVSEGCGIDCWRKQRGNVHLFKGGRPLAVGANNGTVDGLGVG